MLQFRAAAKSMRSALIDRIRKAAPIIFNLSPEVFKPNYKREKVPALTQLLKFNPQLKRLSKFPPVLYPPIVRQRGHDGFETKLFQSSEVFRVSR
jgi:hypothetical protein